MPVEVTRKVQYYGVQYAYKFCALLHCIVLRVQGALEVDWQEYQVPRYCTLYRCTVVLVTWYRSTVFKYWSTVILLES